MKRTLFFIIISFFGSIIYAQGKLNLSGKVFQQVHKIQGSTSELKFKSNTEVVYVITNVIGAKTYIDECPGKATVQGNKITINCICSDRELYPDPLKDSFTFDEKTQNLISTSYRSLDGVYFTWKQK
jgi:hypothetical protein